MSATLKCAKKDNCPHLWRVIVSTPKVWAKRCQHCGAVVKRIIEKGIV